MAPNNQKDERLYSWMQMIVLGTNGTGIFKKIARKECERLLYSLGFTSGEIDETTREKLHELAKKYINVSLDSPNYASSVLGLKRATKDEAKIRMCSDIKRGACDYLLKFNKQKESQILFDIFKTEFCNEVKEGEEIWNKCFSDRIFNL